MFVFYLGGYTIKFFTGRLCPKVHPLTLLYTIFDRKGTPFIYPLLANCTPFTYLAQNFPSFLTAVNSLSLKYKLTTKPESFLNFLTLSHKMYLLALFCVVTTKMTCHFLIIIFLHFYTPEVVKSQSFHIPDA